MEMFEIGKIEFYSKLFYCEKLGSNSSSRKLWNGEMKLVQTVQEIWRFENLPFKN